MPGPRLSEHIILGDTLRKREPSIWLDCIPELPCGCALGGAMLSLGARRGLGFEEIVEQWPWLYTAQVSFTVYGIRCLETPYGIRCLETPLDAISTLFREVCAGRLTLESLAQQVRVWEDEYDESLRAGATDEADEPAVACAEEPAESTAAVVA